MPQDDFGFEPIVKPKKKQTEDFGFEPVSSSTGEEHRSTFVPKTPTWPEWFTQQALSMGPMVAGSIGGSAAGPAGTIIGGAGGAGIGSKLRQEYDISHGFREKFSPGELALETAMGGIPFAGEMPGKGATAEQLLKYARKVPFSHGAQGALLGATGAVASSEIERGELPSLREVGGSAIGGGLMAAGGSTLFGAMPARSRARGLEAIANAKPAVAGEIKTTPPPPPPPTAASTPPPAGPPAERIPAKPGDHIVEVNPADTGAVEAHKQQGYEQYGVSSDGKFQMIRRGGAAAVPRLPNVPPSTGASIPAVGNTLSYHPDDPIIIPQSQMSAALFQKFKEQGIEFQGVTQDGSSVFKDTGVVPERNIEEASSGGTGEQNRDVPSEMSRPIMPGEPTGRVAQFPTPNQPTREPTHQFDVNTGEVTPIPPKEPVKSGLLGDFEMGPPDPQPQALDEHLQESFRGAIEDARSPEELQQIMDHLSEMATGHATYSDWDNSNAAYALRREAEVAKNRMEGRDAYGQIPGPIPPELRDAMQRSVDSMNRSEEARLAQKYPGMDPRMARRVEAGLDAIPSEPTGNEEPPVSLDLHRQSRLQDISDASQTPEVVSGGAPRTMADEALAVADQMEAAGDIEGARQQRQTVARMLREEGNPNWADEIPDQQGTLPPREPSSIEAPEPKYQGWGGRDIPSQSQAPNVKRDEVVAKFRQLPVVTDPRMGRFILPDGTLVGRSGGYDSMHFETAAKVGSNLKEALENGIVRYSHGVGIETNSRITTEQAATAIDYQLKWNGSTEMYVDGMTADGKHFWEPIDGRGLTAEKLKNIVNKKFDDYERSLPSTAQSPGSKTNDVIEKFRSNLPATNDFGRTLFILPDGTQLTSHIGYAEHEHVADAVGSDIGEALASGVMRFRMDGGAEVGAPITYEQAQALIDSLRMYPDKIAYIDVMTNPDSAQAPVSRVINSNSTAEGIRNWVNGVFAADKRLRPSFMEQSNGTTEDEFIRMEPGDRVQMLRNMQGQFADSGARAAAKELVQNGMDATQTGGKVQVIVNHKTEGKGPSITVIDEGPGLPIEMLRNEYTKLTESGKRDKPSITGRPAIGEMGVGKATYLLGVDSFEVTTITKEPDGSTWKYEMSGTPESMIGKDANDNDVAPSVIKKTRMPDNTPTGTTVTAYDSNVKHIESAENYLNAFAKYSSSPVELHMKGNRWLNQDINLNEVIPVREIPLGEQVSQGTAPGGDFTLHLPEGVKWRKNSMITMVINNRGTFQGVEYMTGIYPETNLPSHVVVNVEPTVSAANAKDYPLTSPTRERMKEPFRAVVEKAIKKDIADKARANARANTQAAYDNLIPDVDPNTGQLLPFVIHDSGDRYTPEERDRLAGSKHVQAFASVMKSVLDKLDVLFPTEQIGGKTKQFGLLASDRGKGGVNLPNPSNHAENAVLVNLHDSIEFANDLGLGPKAAAKRLLHLIQHEFAHNIARSEDGDLTWAMADVDTRFSDEEADAAKKAILAAITGPDGNYAPEIQELLRQHTEARGRADTTIDYLKRSATGYVNEASGPDGLSDGIGSDGERIPSEASGPIPGGGGLTKEPGEPEKPLSVVREAINFTRGATTTGDLSAPMRQGLPLIHRKEWWTSWKQQLTSLGSEDAYQANLAALKRRPMFQSRIDLDPNSRTFGKKTKSFAEQAGIKLSDVSTGMNNREEAVASNWLESGEMLGHGIAQKAYKSTIGRYARSTNRAYTAFLNQLRADTFEALIKDAERDFQAGTKGSKSPMNDLPYAREIADFVNTATGKGPLRMARPSVEGGRLHLKEANFERNAQLLTDVLFAPRLFASRMRMLNPMTYMMATPYVRKQYLKSALAVAGAWGTATSLGYMAGQAGIADVDVSLDPNSADFGKMRINNTRLDPAGGFQQYLVALSRFLSGRTTSSATQRDTELGAGFHADTRKDIAERFMVNKLTPVMKFGWDLMAASQYQPFHVADRTAQMFVPLIVQDVIELSKEDPSLLPLIGPIATGMGSQSYDKGETVGKLVPTEHDWILQGGDPMQRDWAEDIPDF